MGLFIRAFGINKQNLSILEYANILTIITTSDKSILMLTNKERILHMLQQAHQPFYPLILSFFSLFISAVSGIIKLRYISILFDIGTIILAYKFATELLRPRFSLLVTFLALINPTLIFYSRTIQPYSLFCFLVTLDTWFFWQAFINNKERYARPYIITAIVSYFTHYLAIISVVSHFFTLLLLYLSTQRSKEYLAKLLLFLKKAIILIISITVYLPATLYTLHSFDETDNLMPLKFALEAFPELLGALIGIPKELNLLIPLFLIFLITALYHIRKENKELFFFITALFSVSVFFEICSLVPLIIKTGGIYLAVRHYIFWVPFLILLLAYFFQYTFLKKYSLNYLAPPLLVLLLGANSVFSLDIISRNQAPNYYEVLRYLKSEVKEKIFVKCTIDWFDPVIFGYYLDAQNFPEFYGLRKYFRILTSDAIRRRGGFYGDEKVSLSNIIEAYPKGLHRNESIKKLCVIDVRENTFDIPERHFLRHKQGYAIMQLRNQFKLLREKKFKNLSLYLFELK
jgi:uncharacterized membrane protein